MCWEWRSRQKKVLLEKKKIGRRQGEEKGGGGYGCLKDRTHLCNLSIVFSIIRYLSIAVRSFAAISFGSVP